MGTYVLALVGGVRYSAMFTQDKAYVYRGKPWCGSARRSRRTSTTKSSGWSGLSRSDFDNIAKYYCDCGCEVVMYEADDNYRRRYLVCPLENESACQYLAVVDLDYPKQARLVIDQLTEELREVRDLVRTERTDHHFIQEEDRAADLKVRADMLKWKQLSAILVVLNIVLVIWVAWVRMCDHDVRLKHSPMRHDKTIIIRRLQASVNKLKATLLEKGHAVRASHDTNTQLAVAVSYAEHRCKSWMITSAITL
ncbi:hypothetical protein Cgig2_006581 [Carnegiea gigantea]|uniref:Uncharacterized protein n=1 Tax=Carnegiea gigantea TaxID=171969 RepID=A0A9Q1QLC6_9CARY|nr:hypothetical protein Cgig2_006581 [Carnegiea gigantea]